MLTKVCSKCGIEKNVSEFHIHVHYKDGHRSICKICRRSPNKEYLPEGLKRCSKCKEIKKIDNFNKRKNRNNNPNPYCKRCEADRAKQYYNENTEECKKKNRKYIINTQYAKKYYDNNRESLNKKSREWIKKNRSKINLYQRKKYKNDINYNICKKLRSRFFDAVKRNSKKSSIINLLGCTIDELRIHLEKQFKDGMSWELLFQGLIHIDHIKPLAKFNMNNFEDQKLAWNYSNLQPLWAEENLKKGARHVA